MLIYQALYFAQLIVFQGGGRFQSFTDVRAFNAQGVRFRLICFTPNKPIILRTVLENKTLSYF